MSQANAAESPKIKTDLLVLAAGWHALADAMEHAVVDPVVAAQLAGELPDDKV